VRGRCRDLCRVFASVKIPRSRAYSLKTKWTVFLFLTPTVDRSRRVPEGYRTAVRGVLLAEAALTFFSPRLRSPCRAEADQRQLDPREDGGRSGPASGHGAAEGHRVLPLAAGVRAARGQAGV